MIGGKFAPFTLVDNEDADMESMLTALNTAATEIDSDIIGKRRQQKKPWVTADILDLCDKKRAEK